MSEDTERVDTRLLPRLTKTNWSTEYKNAVHCLALNYGEAGEIILSGTDIVIAKPLRTEKITKAGAAVDKYPDDARGDKLFERDNDKYEKFMDQKKKLMSKLISTMDKEVYDDVTNDQTFKTIMKDFMLHELWQLMEQCCVGRGAVSIYTTITRLLKLRQEGDQFVSYNKAFTELTVDLGQQGTPDVILKKILNALYVIGLNQEQFKDILTPIYGTMDWKDRDALSKELTTYAEATTRMKSLLSKDNLNGVVSANKSEYVGCYNCGSSSHMKNKCTKDPHKCSKCGMFGHLEKYCRKGSKKETEESSDEVDEPKTSKDKKRTRKTFKGNKAKARERVLQKVMAKLCDLEEDSGDDDEFSNDDDDDDEDEKSVVGCMTKCCFHDLENVVAMNAKAEERLFKIDSGCRGAHVLTKDTTLMEEIDMSKWKKIPMVHGISGDGIATTKAGRLGSLDGIALVTPEADSDLLSLMELVKSCNGTFHGDKTKLIVKNGEGNVMLSAKNLGDDFWSVTESDLASSISANAADAIDVQPQEEQYQTIINQPGLTERHFTAEQRSRAQEAHNLCRLLRHPGDATIIKALDSNLFVGCHLTSQDFRNGRELLGPCLACVEGKMVAPTEKTSTSPPATKIGEHLHVDMIILEVKSIGGNTIIIVAKDEFSGYAIGVPSKDKSEKTLKNVGELLLAEMNMWGHKVREITTDDEQCFKVWTKHLAMYGVKVSPTPSGLHEKRAERCIRTIKEHKAATIADLAYELPKDLYCEAFMDTITWLNRVPNKDTGDAFTSPYQLVTGRKCTIPSYTFGQTGLFHTQKKATRSEWGIFIGYGNDMKYLRSYSPLTRQVTSKRRFEPQHAYPTAWKFKPRLQPRVQVQQPIAVVPVTAPAPVPEPVMTTPTPIQGQAPDRTNHVDTSRQEGDALETAAQYQTAQEGAANENVIQETTRESAASEGEGDINVTTTTQPSEPMQIKMEQPQETVASKPQLIKSIVKDQTRRSKRNAGTWQDGPARFKGLMLSAFCTQAESSKFNWMKANKTSLKRALEQKGRRESVQASIDAEIDNLEQPGVLRAVKFKDIPIEAWKDIINAYMFHKEKFKANGSFDKDKCRIVLLSNLRDPNSIGDSFSPTVNPISVMTQLNVAATNKKTVTAAYDIKGAFLLTPVEEGVELYLRVGPELAEFWIARKPERIEFLHEDGCLYFKLDRYVYGLHEAPNKFNGFLDEHLKKIGFVPSTVDKCFYIKETDEGKIMLSDHVDDMLLTFPSIAWRKWFEEAMNKFQLVSQYDEVSYLGIQIKREKNGDITLSQKGYIQSMLKRYGLESMKKVPKRPSTEDLTKEDEEGKQVSSKEYLSLVMGLMYAARFTRPDVAFSVAYLATRCSNPTEGDMGKAMRVLKYLGGTIEEVLRYKHGVSFKPRIYADASHHLYETGHGQAGMIITNGSAPVCHRSAKLKLVTRSSAESELCSLEDASCYAIWYKRLLIDMGVGFEDQPIEVLQDNKSTIIMATQGCSFKRNKHLQARKFFVQERIESKDIILRYCKTDDMAADIMTKAVDKATLNRLKTVISVGN